MVGLTKKKANVRTKTEAVVKIPPNVTVTEVAVSHRKIGGKFVYDVIGPDGMTIDHRPKELTESQPEA